MAGRADAACVPAGIVLAAGVAALSSSCASPGGTPSGAPDGRRLYLTCAASCHSAEPIRKYSRTEWEKILPEMIGEARMPAGQAAILRDYVFSHLGP